MNEFKTYHPIVSFTYFLCVIGFSMFFMHPLCLAFSLCGGFCYSVVLGGGKAAKRNIALALPMMLFTALLNPAFNHEGATILTYLPGGNPLTLESIIYGAAAGAMIAAVIFWFSCYNAVMTGDKFIYLFGRIIPSLSLIFSMVLRFVPKFAAQLKIVSDAQRGIGRDASNGNLLSRIKHSLSILSIMTTWSLESSIDTADSMRARGYGLSGRTAFSIYTFDRRDAKALCSVVFLGIYILTGGICGRISFGYFPSLKAAPPSLWGTTIYIAYALLCAVPLIIEGWEDLKWKSIKSKI